MTNDLEGRSAEGCAIHERLKAAVEKRQTSYLWVKGDTPPFKPALLPMIYGDGRALFALATLNQRPKYYVIRGDSRWCVADDYESGPGPEFVELTDDLLADLEEAFGSGRCSYSGNSLFWPKKERLRECQCEGCSDSYVAKWPELDDEGGCSWGRLKWPKGFETVPHPLSSRGDLLATETGHEHPAAKE